MLLFYAKNLMQTFNGRDIFRQVSFEVQFGEKVALIGVNGVGKTSLLRILAGIDQPFAGKVDFLQPVQIGTINQNFFAADELTIREFLEDNNGSETQEEEKRHILKRFGFSGQGERKIAGLSGGEKTRLQLARISRLDNGLLLLDEPSNHLDTQHLDWLERFVADYRGTVVLVSHDRYFLDRTVSRVLELSPEGVQSYPGNYTEYQRSKAEQHASELKTYTDQMKKSRQLERAIEEQKQWSGLAHSQSRAKSRANGIRSSKTYYRSKAKKMDRRVKSTIGRLERLRAETIAQPKALETIHLGFQNAGNRRDGLLLAENLNKAFGARVLFTELSFSLKPGEKAVLIGPNGCGKSTLLRMIAGLETLDSGRIWRSPSMKMGYQEQELRLINEERTVLEELADSSADQKAVRNLLAGLLFKGEDVHKPCAVLSMGERVRVVLAKMLMSDCDLLLLDEPTNYLDLATRERLEEALMAFQGAVIIVSHDRYLAEKVASTIWEMDKGKLRKFPGRYSEYMEHLHSQKKSIQNAKEERMTLELRKAFLIGQLATFPKQKDPEAFQRMEEEYLSVLEQMRK